MKLVGRVVAVALVAACRGQEAPETGQQLCEVSVVDTVPTDGAQDAFYRADIEFMFSAPDNAADVVLTGPQGELSGTTWFRSEGAWVVFTPDEPLLPETDYTAQLEFCAGRPEVAFRTSDLGQSVDLDAMLGRTWTLDPASARYVLPQGLGAVLASQLLSSSLMQLVARDGDELSFLRGTTLPESGEQSTCVPTVELIADASDAPFFSGTVEEAGFFWTLSDNSYLPIDVFDETFSGVFSVDGTYLGGGRITGWVSAHDLAQIEGGSQNELCELAPGFGASCEPCPRGDDQCLYFEVDQIVAEEGGSVLPYGDLDGDGFDTCDDCDDNDPEANPDADEICDEVDNDCDGEIDEGVKTNFYPDADGDGYGSDAPGGRLNACEQPTGYVTSRTDCDDADPDVHPHATERCNGVDDDCDDDTDEDVLGDDEACPGLSCLDILGLRPDALDGDYWIAPVGTATQVVCDMTTDGGGWTGVAYAADLPLDQQRTGGDGWAWLHDDLSLVLSFDDLEALQARSTEGRQTFEGQCDGMVLYFDSGSVDFAQAVGFRFPDGSETPYGSSSYAPYDIEVTRDECSAGGEGTTTFELSTPVVPVVNVQLHDGGDGGERFGSPLTEHPAWLR